MARMDHSYERLRANLFDIGVMKKITLDFSLFASDTKFPEFSEELSLRLKAMPETLERANSAVMFAQQAERQSESWASAAFLRAALADLCSMEEMQKTDRPTSSSSWVKIENGDNPFLHFLVLLRHLNIHVKTIDVESDNSGLTRMRPPNPTLAS